MMTKLSCNVVAALDNRTLATAESCTGGGIGAAITAVPGSSNVYKGGIISYTNDVKISQLHVDPLLISREGAVSAAVAEAMATGVRNALCTDIAVSTTGLAGPGGDDYGNPVGTVFIGYADAQHVFSEKFLFCGDRDEVRQQAASAALQIILREIGER